MTIKQSVIQALQNKQQRHEALKGLAVNAACNVIWRISENKGGYRRSKRFACRRGC